MEYWVIDRLEEGYAVCEHGDGMENIPAELLPEGAREGDCLFRCGEGFAADREETRRRREENLRLTQALFGE
ncbi:MAG: DUF3006 domain-containing protein [Oscillospiraceae bacterium]|nr:DUF3006 domain-containing protein [Oscillospiraceae bacterium]